MKEWMAPADPPLEVGTTKKMNGRLLLLGLNKITHYFKEWTTAIEVLKKRHCLCKHLMPQLDSLNSSCFQNYSIPKENWGCKYSERAAL